MDKKNILIISEESDNTTDTVLKWIKYFGGEFLRLNHINELALDLVHLGNDSDDVLEYTLDLILREELR